MRGLCGAFVLAVVVGLAGAASVDAVPLERATIESSRATAAPEARCAVLRKKLARAKRRKQRVRVRTLTRALKKCLRNARRRQPPPPQPPPQAHRPGQTSLHVATCKYGSAPYPGYLRISTRPPYVMGTPTRAGAEWVRYGAWLVDTAGNTVNPGSWSGFLAAGDSAWATWSGETSFTHDWRGNYRIMLRIEWWDESKLLASQVHQVNQYTYIDEWNTNWGGPFPSCMRQPV
jgi:hypothetical protein